MRYAILGAVSVCLGEW